MDTRTELALAILDYVAVRYLWARLPALRRESASAPIPANRVVRVTRVTPVAGVMGRRMRVLTPAESAIHRLAPPPQEPPET